MKKITLSFDVDVDTHNILINLAESKDIPLSSYLEEIIEDFVEQEEEEDYDMAQSHNPNAFIYTPKADPKETEDFLNKIDNYLLNKKKEDNKTNERNNKFGL